MPEKLTEEAFAQHLNTKFRARVEAPRPLELLLTQVRRYDTGSGERNDMERFSLYFQGPPDMMLPQGTYTFDHEGMGELALFIVPIGRDEDGFRYEVVFNYFRK